jgi:hypothetical protein
MGKAKTTLDVGWSDDAGEANEANARSECEAFVREYAGDARFEIVIENVLGPGGGAIVATFVGERADVETLAIEYERRAAYVSDGAGGWVHPPLTDDERAHALSLVESA